MTLDQLNSRIIKREAAKSAVDSVMDKQPANTKVWSNRVKGMKHLKELTVVNHPLTIAGHLIEPRLRILIMTDPLLRNCAHSLVQLNLGHDYFPFSGETLFFPCLKKLSCVEIEDSYSNSFPALTHLSLIRQYSPTIFKKLPVKTMVSLNVSVYQDYKRPREFEETFTKSISNMVNLNQLIIPHLIGVVHDFDEMFGRMFDRFTRLTKMHIQFPGESRCKHQLISMLVRSNPNLQDIKLEMAGLKDPDVGIIAEHLKTLTHFHLIQRTAVHTNAVLTLMRSTCCSIRSVILENVCNNVDVNQIQEEINLLRNGGNRFMIKTYKYRDLPMSSLTLNIQREEESTVTQV